MGQFSKPTRKDSNDIVLILQSLDNWQRLPNLKRLEDYGVQAVWKRFIPEQLKLEEATKNAPF